MLIENEIPMNIENKNLPPKNQKLLQKRQYSSILPSTVQSFHKPKITASTVL